MRSPLSALLLLMLLGACPPGQPSETATDATTAGTTAATSGPTSGQTSSQTGDMSSGTATTTTTGDATSGPATATTTADPGTTGSTGSTTGSTGTTTTTTTTSGTTGGTTGGASTFLCDGCLCDADTTYCRKVLAGLTDFQGDPPMCPVVPDDPLVSGCVAYPAACGDAPTCDCIPNLNNNCFCEESMGTFTLTCPLP